MFDAQKYKNQYEKETYYEVKIRLPKEKKAIMHDLTKTTGKSINRIFIEAVEKVHDVDLTCVDAKADCYKYLYKKVPLLREMGVSAELRLALIDWAEAEISARGNSVELMEQIEQKCRDLIQGR